VAVSQIVIDPEGRLMDVSILEAPSPAIESSVMTALKQWTFAGNFSGYTQISAKLTFYFIFKDNIPVVLSPEQAQIQNLRFVRPASSYK
jgi:hypothetical protein